MSLSIETDGPNRDEIEFWNGPQGQNWVTQNRLTDLMYDPFGDKTIERAALQPGERVIDIGCGCGKTTGKLAELVGPAGHVTAMDVSIPMLNVARRQLASGSKQLEFVAGDAETYDFTPGAYDVLFSQFGVMFFADTQAAFSNFYTALKPGGRVAFVGWRHPELNPWLTIPFDAVHQYVPDMPRPRPGLIASPFSLAQQAQIEDFLKGAGFVDVELDIFDHPARMGQGDLDECLNFVADFSASVAAALRKSDPDLAPAIMSSVRSAVAPYHVGNTLELPGSTWIVSARRP